MTVISEFAMHVVKPVVDRTSLADTIIVKAAKSGIPIIHRENNSSDFILKGITKICSQDLSHMQLVALNRRLQDCIR